ncbi:MAG: hypothetical protein IT487_07905 [Chromatiaceae bacterium]|nr:hypothetical protein [Chromatiaceae bacterium]
MSLPYDVWAVGGSRKLSPAGRALAQYVAGQLLAARARLAVGCCTGADAAFIECAAGRGFASRLWIFSAFGPIEARAGAVAAAGTCRSSAVGAVAAAKSSGAAIIPWAGGRPDMPVVARLRARTTQVAYAATAGGVIVADGQFGPGSLLLASHLAAHGCPVYAVTLAPMVPPPGPGGWLADHFLGLPCWRLPATAPAALAIAA